MKKSTLGLKNRVLLSVFLLIAVTSFIFTYVIVGVYERKMNEKNASFYRQNIANVISHLNDYMDEIGAIANEVNYDYVLQNYIREISGEESTNSYSNLSSVANMRDYELAMQMFSSTINDRTDVTSIFVFGKKRMLLYRSMYSYSSVVMDYTACSWYQKALENEGEAVVTGPAKHEFLSQDSSNTLTVSRTIHDYETGDEIGVILIDINCNQIQEYLDEISAEDGGRIVILNENGDYIAEQPVTEENTIPASDDVMRENLFSAIGEDVTGRSLVTMQGEKYQIVYQTMERTGWKILSITPYRIYQRTTILNMVEILVLFVCLMVILMVGLNKLLGKIVSPVRHLIRTVDMADTGNLSIRATVDSRDEIGQLAESFNAMLERIENLKEQVISEQEEKRVMELQALQAQINPHFLYNTLDAIIWMAETDNADIVPMTEALARFFRISLNKGKEFILVQGELDHVENYLVIQSMRYTDKFSYYFDIDDKVKDLLTIKLIIQPIVENCIYHGIKQKRGKGNIWIQAYMEGSYLKILVKDDGVGMSAEKCHKILNSSEVFENSSGSGIGIKNVNERIKLCFGESYGLSYQSTLGVGTIVTVTLPVIKKEEIKKERW